MLYRSEKKIVGGQIYWGRIILAVAIVPATLLCGYSLGRAAQFCVQGMQMTASMNLMRRKVPMEAGVENIESGGGDM